MCKHETWTHMESFLVLKVSLPIVTIYVPADLLFTFTHLWVILAVSLENSGKILTKENRGMMTDTHTEL